jgi:putative acetyltransferase
MQKPEPRDGFETRVRLARNSDAQGLLGLLALCFAQYPGCYVDPHEDLRDLMQPETSFSQNGIFWVVDDHFSQIGASCAVEITSDGDAELHRLYVRPDMRRTGIAQYLLARAEDFAAERGAGRITLWTDTRFETGHAFYRRAGYEQQAQSRTLADISHSTEFLFEKKLLT